MPLPATLPLMTLVGAIVRVLPPPPPPTEVNWIAAPPADVIVPALNTVELSNANIPPVMVPPRLLVMAPLFIEIAAPPRPPLTVPKLVTVRNGVDDPETPKPSPVMMPDA